jgi:hypothetical protein
VLHDGTSVTNRMGQKATVRYVEDWDAIGVVNLAERGARM